MGNYGRLEGAVSVIWVVFYSVTLVIYWYVFSHDFIPRGWIDTLKYSNTDSKWVADGNNMSEGEQSRTDRNLSLESFKGRVVEDSMNKGLRDVELTGDSSSSSDPSAPPLSRSSSVSDAPSYMGRIQEGLSSVGGAALKSYMVSSTWKTHVTFMHTSSEVIRYYSVHCSARADVGRVLEAGMDDTFSPKQIAKGSRIEAGAVPTAKLTHVEMITEQEYDMFGQLVKYCIFLLQWLFDFICRWTPIALGVFASVIIINCFYVTLQMGDDDSSASMTKFLFVLTVFCIAGELLLSFQGWRRGNRTVMITHGVLAAYLMICFALIMELVYLVDGGDDQNNDDESKSKTKSVNFAPWKCECGGGDTSRRLQGDDYGGGGGGGSSGVDHGKDDYFFTCSSSNYDDICSEDCGVCGSPFYGVFVSYCVFFTPYLFAALFFAFFSLYHSEIRMSNINLVPPNVHSNALLTLHGSHAYGYPLKVRLALDEGLAMMKIFEKVHHEGDFSNKRPILDASRPPPGIATAASKSADAVTDGFMVVFKFIMQMIKTIL
jgi:hypothetical protein